LVADAAVVVLTPASGEKQLVACIALVHAAEDAEAQLRQWLGERLSRAAIPQHCLFLDHLPINANGKLDRNALRVHCETLFQPRVPSSDKPASVLLQMHAVREIAETLDASQIMSDLQQLWAALLGRTAVGTDESFFDLGGTSLLLIEMHARLKTQFASTPSLVDMFSFPTPRSLAERLVTGGELPRKSEKAEQHGQRQRAAMLARRAASAAAREDVAG
jgi:hypothetical protein